MNKYLEKIKYSEFYKENLQKTQLVQGLLSIRDKLRLATEPKGRKTSPKEGSYTTYLFEKGKEKILKKVGEECTEVIIAGEKEDKAETVYEISDLAYHVLVLMVQAGITVEDITRELEKRHVIDHKVKQERMQ